MSEWSELGRLYLYVGIVFGALSWCVFCVVLFFILRVWLTIFKDIQNQNKGK